jgi:DNA-binding transcriptional ArsR family regulator
MAAGECSPVLKALSDQTRQRIVKVLLERDLSVNELTEALALSQYNTSKHLAVLKSAGIVIVRAAGARREYFIAPGLRRTIRERITLDFGCCTFRMDQLAD